jgi:hypothetical protein
MKQYKKHSANNTKRSKYKYTYYQNTHTLQNPHTHTHTHLPTHTRDHWKESEMRKLGTGPRTFIVKPTSCTSFSHLFYFGIKLYMFRTVFPSIIRSLRLYILVQQQVFVKRVLLPDC